MTEQDVDESEQSSLEEPPEEEPSAVPNDDATSDTDQEPTAGEDRSVFNAADNSPARQSDAQGEPGQQDPHSAPTRPVRFPSAGSFGMVGFGG